MRESTVSVRYMVDDVEAAIAFYTKVFGFTLGSNMAPAFADVTTHPAKRTYELGGTSDAGRAQARPRWLEPDSLHR